MLTDEPVEAPNTLLHKLQDLAAISKVISGPGTSLLSLDINGRRHVTTDIGLGRVDRAVHVTTLVPGVNSQPSRNLGDKVEEARDLLDVAADLSAQAGEDVDATTHAAIVSMGYEAPQLDGRGLPEIVRGLQQTVTDDVARDAGPGYADFLNSLDVTRAEDPHLTVAGHSYGSLASSHALQHGTGVDDFVALGSPGTGVDDVAELKVPHGHVHNLEAKGDLVADSGWFGRDLSYLDGVRQLDTAGHDDLGLTEVRGHTSYYASGSTSQHNVAAVASGHHEMAIDDTRAPDLTDEVRDDLRKAKGWVDDRLDDLRGSATWCEEG
ncbi:alpha/beta hydrolase [Nocardioides alcanivorans]|uniref:alpha/beta hydrolase n=1 Tax=Nocardioides alcanivorans TaxID=2897352 RepID=UPI001F3DE961|nr:alpha/beta hydrolase [Nocardioides alcanivorans]